jgi:hypothetical protein
VTSGSVARNSDQQTTEVVYFLLHNIYKFSLCLTGNTIHLCSVARNSDHRTTEVVSVAHTDMELTVWGISEITYSHEGAVAQVINTGFSLWMSEWFHMQSGGQSCTRAHFSPSNINPPPLINILILLHSHVSNLDQAEHCISAHCCTSSTLSHLLPSLMQLHSTLLIGQHISHLWSLS